MATQEEIQQIFPNMMDSFQPDKAQDANATIQFNLSGDNGGQYWVKVSDGSATYGEGTAAGPDMTLTSSADDFYNLVTGKLNPMQAFMMGKLKVDNTGLGMKMMSWFKLG